MKKTLTFAAVMVAAALALTGCTSANQTVGDSNSSSEQTDSQQPTPAANETKPEATANPTDGTVPVAEEYYSLNKEFTALVCELPKLKTFSSDYIKKFEDMDSKIQQATDTDGSLYIASLKETSTGVLEALKGASDKDISETQTQQLQVTCDSAEQYQATLVAQ